MFKAERDRRRRNTHSFAFGIGVGVDWKAVFTIISGLYERSSRRRRRSREGVEINITIYGNVRDTRSQERRDGLLGWK